MSTIPQLPSEATISPMPGGFDPYRRYTADEYFAFCDKTEERLELYDGYIRVKDWDTVRMMAGGSLNHSQICDRVLIALSRIAEERGCEVNGSHICVPNMLTGSYVYPDVSYVCDPQWERRESALLSNPSLVVEVLSPGTGDYDLTEKFSAYQRLPSILAVLFLRSDRRGAQLYERRDAGVWLVTLVDGDTEKLLIPSLDLSLAMADLYRNVKISDEPPMPPVNIPSKDAV